MFIYFLKKGFSFALHIVILTVVVFFFAEHQSFLSLYLISVYTAIEGIPLFHLYFLSKTIQILFSARGLFDS